VPLRLWRGTTQNPGFLVLDTPLLTYRDRLRSREGALSADEQVIRKHVAHVPALVDNFPPWTIHRKSKNVDLP
jgi:hypothetical protein